MGLDQYAYKVKSDYSSDTKTETITKTEIAYWRKHNRLQGWMEERFFDKGGDGTFNCKSLHLDEDDINELEQAINSKNLPSTAGFFFGDDSYEDYEGEYGYKKDDEEFIEEARKALKDGWQIQYYCWW